MRLNVFFLFQINPARHSYQVYRYRAGKRETLAEGRLDLYHNQNNLKVTVDKNTLSFYCNERFLVRKSSSTPKNLQVGLAAGAGDRTPFEVSFDNFKVTGSGKIVREKAGKRHLLEHKSSRVTRRMSGTEVVSENDAPRIKRLLNR